MKYIVTYKVDLIICRPAKSMISNLSRKFYMKGRSARVP